MKTTSTSTAKFTVALQRHGLALPGVSLKTVEFLRNMAANPVPLVEEFHQAGRSGKSRKSPGGSFSIGPLIRHGLARKNGPQYEATEKGQEYLAKLEKLKLINRALEEQP